MSTLSRVGAIGQIVRAGLAHDYNEASARYGARLADPSVACNMTTQDRLDAILIEGSTCSTCTPDPATRIVRDREERARCTACRAPLTRFVIEDDERRDRWSRWAVAR